MFDLVKHVIKHLLSYSCFNLFRSYLADRYFQIKYGQEKFKFHPVYTDVPQRSGPRLFTVYAPSVYTFQKDAEVVAFTEDTVFLSKNSDAVEASDLIELLRRLPRLDLQMLNKN